MLYRVDLEVDKHEAAQDAVIKDQIDLVVRVIERDAILPADEGEALAQFEEELLEVVAKHRFELRFRHLIRLGDFQELEDIRLAQQVGGLFDNLACAASCMMPALSLLAARRRNSDDAFCRFNSGTDQRSAMACFS